MAVDEVFVNRVGHDLRGELATMVAGVHYVLRYEPGLGDTARQMLDRVNGAGQRLRRLLDELELSVWIDRRDLSDLDRAPVAPRAIVDAAIERLAALRTTRDVRVEARVPADLPASSGEPELLTAALEMALDLAIARSPRGSVVELAATAEDGRVVLVITDAGPPVAPDVLARLLEPFAEREAVPPAEAGTRRRDRLGLGAAIARGVLEAHGGGLTASDAPGGQGLRLRCVLGPAIAR